MTETNHKNGGPSRPKRIAASSKKRNAPQALLLSPMSLLVGMILGVLVGLYAKPSVPVLTIIGHLYLAFLKMCILPMVVAAVIFSIAQLLQTPGARRYIIRSVVLLTLGMLLAGIIGLVPPLINRPGTNLANQQQRQLGSMISEHEETCQYTPAVEISALGGDVDETPRLGVLDFILDMIPANVFRSLTESSFLSVIFFSIALGMAVAFFAPERGEMIINLFYAIYNALQLAFSFAMYFLPIGVGCLLASLMDQIEYNVVSAMTPFVISFLIGIFVFMVINGLVFRVGAKIPFFKSLYALRKTLSVALGTRNTLVALPSALKALNEDLGVDERCASLVTPIGMVLCPFGYVMTFAAATVFFAQIYGINLGPAELAVVVIGSAAAGIAAVNAPGLAAYSLLPILFDPLQIPCEPALVLMIVLHPAIEPFMTLINVQGNCAVAAVAACGIEESGA